MRVPIAPVSLSLVIILALFHLDAAALFAAPSQFVHPQARFSLQLPEQFEATPDPHPGVAVLVKPKAGGYPTFNVMAISGGYDLSQNQSTRQNKILDDYARVGLNDLEIVNDENEIPNPTAALEITVRYNLAALKLRSKVTIFSASDRHFVLTFVSEDKEFDRLAALRSSFVEGFEFDGRLTPPLRKSNSSSRLWVLAAIMVVICAIGVLRLRNRGA